MTQKLDQNITIYTLPQTWYGRFLAAVVGALLFFLAIFFFTFFIIIFALLAIVATVYLFLFGRKQEKTTPSNIIQVEYFLSKHADNSDDLDQRKDDSHPS